MKNYVAFPRAARSRNNLVYIIELLTYLTYLSLYVFRLNCTFTPPFDRSVLVVTRKLNGTGVRQSVH